MSIGAPHGWARHDGLFLVVDLADWDGACLEYVINHRVTHLRVTNRDGLSAIREVITKGSERDVSHSFIRLARHLQVLDLSAMHGVTSIADSQRALPAFDGMDNLRHVILPLVGNELIEHWLRKFRGCAAVVVTRATVPPSCQACPERPHDGRPVSPSTFDWSEEVAKEQKCHEELTHKRDTLQQAIKARRAKLRDGDDAFVIVSTPSDRGATVLAQLNDLCDGLSQLSQDIANAQLSDGTTVGSLNVERLTLQLTAQRELVALIEKVATTATAAPSAALPSLPRPLPEMVESCALCETRQKTLQARKDLLHKQLSCTSCSSRSRTLDTIALSRTVVDKTKREIEALRLMTASEVELHLREQVEKLQAEVSAIASS